MAKTLTIYVIAALCEIGGCYSVWAWWRLKASALWLIPGAVALFAFAWLLSQIDTAAAGRAYAAYGAIYIAASVVWMWGVEKQRPDVWDLSGVTVCLIGASLILLAPRSA